MNKKLVKLSKFISLVLRHNPGAIGLSLDEAGWVEVDALLANAQQAGQKLDLALLKQVVAQNDKKRFVFSEDGTRIRANHGHSIGVNLGYEAITPPEILFHGTATRFLESIKSKGLIRQNRDYVHLSIDEVTAYAVARRHGKPAILTVQSGQMAQAGFSFFRSGSGIWLTETVPVTYLVFP